MNNKTVKEKVEEIIKKQTLAIICKECNGGGYNYDKKENCEECEGTGLSEWRFGTAVEDIDKLYRKEITKEVVNMTIDLGRFGYGDSLVTVVTKTIRQVEEGLKQPKPRMKVLKKMPKEYCSYTCCNIEVSEPKGTEVHCSGCGEWCETK